MYPETKQRKFFWIVFALLAAGMPASQAQMVPINQPLKEGEIWVAGRIVNQLQQAFDYATDDAIIHIGPGVFRQAGVLRRDHVRLVGSQGTVLDGVVAEGKAALVIGGRDILIENITCRNIAAPDQNGACIRFEGENLTLKNIQVFDSEEGLLTHDKPGRVIIEDSRFERVGKAGRAHGIYVTGGQLEVRRSFFLSGQDEGHEIKSRAETTLIEYCVIASKDGPDSRLIDIPDGGVATIRENLLVEGPKSVNWQLLSFGVENQRYSRNLLLVEKNLIISDRPGGSELIGLGASMPPPIFRGNIIVGKVRYEALSPDNYVFERRSDISLPDAPLLPDWNPADAMKP